MTKQGGVEHLAVFIDRKSMKYVLLCLPEIDVEEAVVASREEVERIVGGDCAHRVPHARELDGNWVAITD